jgi:hypothetical protein
MDLILYCAAKEEKCIFLKTGIWQNMHTRASSTFIFIVACSYVGGVRIYKHLHKKLIWLAQLKNCYKDNLVMVSNWLYFAHAGSDN